MSFQGLAIVAIAAALMAVNFKSFKAEYGIYISIGICILATTLVLSQLEYLIEVGDIIRSYIGLDQVYISTMLKRVGRSYVAEFASDVCKDCGYSSMANQVQVVGKLTVLCISMPILLALLECINGVLGV
ncbi:MAG: stage III sporulation protein AD, partial [Lachnospiraceae bacterium]|nr:stage III sporulation protein AD [Lachnospiraceae bacterium]